MVKLKQKRQESSKVLCLCAALRTMVSTFARMAPLQRHKACLGVASVPKRNVFFFDSSEPKALIAKNGTASEEETEDGACFFQR